MNHLKLTDVINPEDQKELGKGLRHVLRNSLKRNLISTSQVKESAFEYQTKLNNHNFNSRDLHRLFSHLYSKDEMTSSDRNLIRRLLLSTFPESLVCAGGKNFILHTNYTYLKKSQIFENRNEFFLVLKGSLKIQSSLYERNVETGMYFGHLQLLGNEEIQNLRITALKNSYLLFIQEKAFHYFLKDYFQKLYEERLKCLPFFITRELSRMEQILLCEEMDKVAFPVATKIVNKGDSIESLIFILNGRINSEEINEKFDESFGKIVGFSEYIQGRDSYDQNYLAVENIVGYSLSLKKYKEIIKEDRFSMIYSQMSKDLSIRKSRMSKQQETKKYESNKKFLRVRKVKLPLKQRMKSSTSKLVSATTSVTEKETSFIFIKGEVEKRLRKIAHNKTEILQPKQDLIESQLQYFNSKVSYF